MPYLDVWRRRVEMAGETRRERQKNKLIRDIERLAPDSLSYKTIVVDGEERQAIVTSSDAYNLKNFISLPGETIPFGAMIQYADRYWLVREKEIDDEIYAKCQGQLCNVLMRWQNTDGDILEYYGVGEDATKYSSGVLNGSDYMITLGEFQIKVALPVNEDTAVIHRDMRFLIDADSFLDTLQDAGMHPTAFKVTRRNIVTGTFDDEGYVEITLVEDRFIDGKDDEENGLAYQPEGNAGTDTDTGADAGEGSEWL